MKETKNTENTTPDTTGTPKTIKAIQECLDIYNQFDPFEELLMRAALTFGLFDRDGKDTETSADDGKDAETDLMNDFLDAYRALPDFEQMVISVVINEAPLGAMIKISETPFPAEEE